MVVQQSSAIPTFCCYAHKDAEFLCELNMHLNLLERLNVIKVWDDGDISAGAEWGPEIRKHLNEAKIILLLISPAFINSNYCYSTEMQHALVRHKQKEARVIPIIVRHTAGWEKVPPGDTQLGDLQALPKEAKPVKSWTDRDEVWKEVTEEIDRVAKELRKGPNEQGGSSSPDEDSNDHLQPPNPPGPKVDNGDDPSHKPFEELKKHLLSRRTVIGAIGLVVGGGGGGITMALRQSQGANAPSSVNSGSTRVASVTAGPTSSASPTPTTTPTLPVGTPLNTYKGHTATVRSIAWASNGQIVSGGDDGTAQVWMWNPPKASFSYSNGNNGTYYTVYAVAWSPDKRYIATANADWRVRIWDTHSPGTEPVVTHTVTPPILDLGTNHPHTNEVYAVAWSPDGKYIAYGGYDMQIHIRRWQDPTADVFTYREHTGQIYTIAWSPDGKYIASAGTDKTVRVWDPLNGKLIYSYGHDNNIYTVAWSPDGLFLASGSTEDTTKSGGVILQVWDVTSFFAKKTSDPQLAKSSQSLSGVSTIYSLMWSPNPKKKGYFAWAGSNGVVQVWDNLGKLINSYNGLTGKVYSVAWSPDGNSIAAGGDSTTILIWSAN